MVITTFSEKIEFIERAFGRIGEKDSKGNIQVKCPKCVEENFKIGITLSKYKFCIALHKNMIFHCWNCGYNGRLSKALKDYCSYNLLVEYLKRFADDQALSMDIGDQTRLNNFRVPPDFRLLATHKLSTDLGIKKALAYAKSRGITNDDLWYFKIGISDEFPWKNRILFPSFDTQGNINCIVGRSWESGMKYHYTDRTKIPKKQFAFNEINLNWSKPLSITEGPIDLVKCDENATILMGSDLSEDSYLFGKIIRHETPIIWSLDPDMIHKKTPKIIKKLLSAGIDVKVPELQDDVGSLTREEYVEIKNKAEKWDHMSLLRNKISSIR